MASTNSNGMEGCFSICNGGDESIPVNTFSTSRPPSFSSLKEQGVPTPNDMDRIIAKEMTGLSMQERENAENDIHGIATRDEEDPLSLETGLLHMKAHLDTTKRETVYEQAENMDPNYVNNRSFRLMFLRADRYDPRQAAERMIRFFELKKSLFGTEKLVQDITLKDLSEDDIETLKSGYMQVAPNTDMAGRSILVGLLKLRKMRAVDNASRVAFYIFMAMMESEEAQKRGVVAVYYLLDATNFQSVTGKLRTTMPVHIAALYLCYNDITQYAVTCMGVYALNHRTRVRFRPHFGSHIECQYALTTFGIPRQALPVSTNGDMYIDQHLQWLQSRQVLETARDAMHPKPPSNMVSESERSTPAPQILWSAVTGPNPVISNGGNLNLRPNDVLFGRGKTVVEHPGNLGFRNIVGMQMEEYEAASRLEKTCMTEKIVQMVKSSDGRFLKRDDGGEWEEVDDETARKKVAHAFRNRRKFHGQ